MAVPDRSCLGVVVDFDRRSDHCPGQGPHSVPDRATKRSNECMGVKQGVKFTNSC